VRNLVGSNEYVPVADKELIIHQTGGWDLSSIALSSASQIRAVDINLSTKYKVARSSNIIVVKSVLATQSFERRKGTNTHLKESISTG
jgi:hypothetical protein